MGNRGFRILVGASVIALLAAVAAYSYNVGVARGIAEGTRILAAPAGAAPVAAVWPRPRGFGVALCRCSHCSSSSSGSWRSAGWGGVEDGGGADTEIAACPPHSRSGTAVRIATEPRQRLTRCSELGIAMPTNYVNQLSAVVDLDLRSQRLGGPGVEPLMEGLNQ
jgi:hypothetical protein